MRFNVSNFFSKKTKRHKNKKRSKITSFLVGVLLLGFAGGFLFAGIFLLWASTLTLPSVSAIKEQRKSQSTKIYDRTGEVLLYDMYKDVQKTEVPLEKISDYVKYATIAIEDDGFYSHFGIEPLSILRAVLKNLQQGDLFGGQGGSTITQQVVKNMLLVSDKKISRKLKEWILAIKLERRLSKDEILELYLNQVPYGGTKYGVEEASQGFFGIPASDLSIAQSAYLAALPQAPTYYSPYGNHKDALEVRKNKVLKRMFELGYISKEEYEQAKDEIVEFRPATSAKIKAPHFVFYVIGELEKMYPNMDISTLNLRVITTLDWDLEREAEQIVYKHAKENEEKFNASNASLMAINPNNGDILVMVGSRDYFDDEIDGNFNIGLAKRQPGSSFKPFAYAAAIERGYTTETVVYDVRTQFSTACSKTNLTSDENCYAPGNYDHKFRGPITFRDALAQSVNVPAVKAMYLAGEKETYSVAKRMGITTLDNYRKYGLTLVLGGGEVSLLEMTSAYATFAHEGFRYPYNSIIEIQDSNKNVMYHHKVDGEQVLDTEVARSITDILADNRARTPAFGANSYLYFPDHDVAAKTGTTNDYRDAWIIGYTPNIAVGAWAGNNDNTSMEKKVAGFIVAPMWNEFLTKYFETHPVSPEFIKPKPLEKNLKPVLRGDIPTNTLGTSTGSTTEISIPHSILYWVKKDDPRGPKPTNPNSDPQYQYWEYGVFAWYTQQKEGTSTPITEKKSPLNTGGITVHIRNPDDGDRVRETERVSVRISVNSNYDIVDVQYYIDGKLIGMKDNEKSRFSFTPKEKGIEKGEHTLLVVVYDSKTRRGGDTIDFTVR